MRQLKFIDVFCAFLIVLAGMLVFQLQVKRWHDLDRLERIAFRELESIAIGTRNYVDRFEKWPTEIKQLFVEYQAGIEKYNQFYLPEAFNLNDDGTLVDVWGTPVMIVFENSSDIKEFRSAGCDLEFFTDDDIAQRVPPISDLLRTSP